MLIEIMPNWHDEPSKLGITDYICIYRSRPVGIL